MSIVSVDNIQPIGSGTTVTVNKSVTLESGNTNITGVCTATSFVGGLPITGGADNRVITAASASAIQGESTLTYNGTNLTISNGNLVIGTAGKGIDFSAQTATSVSGTTVTSELLDHYEEGNWLPDIRGSSTAGTATYTSRNGRYVRIGRIVHVYTDVRWSAHNGAGGLEVHGLPFPQTGGYWGHFGINYNAGHSWTSGRQIYGWVNIGGDFIRYWQTDSNGGSGNLPLDSVVGEIHFYGHYLTST